MKASPRPPRRFSRWQTTKRTFVLGGGVSKPPQISTQQDTSAQLTETSKTGRNSMAQDVETGGISDIGLGGTQPGSAKPKHVRKLQLVPNPTPNGQTKTGTEFQQQKHAERSVSQSSGLTQQTGESGTSREKPNLQTENLTGQFTPPKTRTGQREVLGGNTSQQLKVSVAPQPSNLPPAGEPVSKKTIQTRSSPRKGLSAPEIRQSPSQAQNEEVLPLQVNEHISSDHHSANLSSVKEMGKERSKVNETEINVTTIPESASSPAGSDKENTNKPESKNGHKKMSRNKQRTISQSERDVSSSDSHGISNSVKRRNLRDRSKLVSPEDMLQSRQYPERFLVGRQGSAVKEKRERDYNYTATEVRKSAIHILKDKQNSKNGKNQTDANSSHPTDVTTGSESEAHSRRAKRTKEINISRSSKAGTSLETDSKSKAVISQSVVRDELTATHQRKMAKKSEHMTFGNESDETQISGGKRAHKPEPIPRDEGKAKKNSPEGKISHGAVSSKKSKHGKEKQSTIEMNKSPVASMIPTAVINHKRTKNVKASVPVQSVNISHETSNASVTHVGTSKMNKSASSRNMSESLSSGERSLRDRSLLPSPGSVQRKRQYPVDFYPSKVRAEILNASLTNRQKRQPASLAEGSQSKGKSNAKKTVNDLSGNKQRKTKHDKSIDWESYNHEQEVVDTHANSSTHRDDPSVSGKEHTHLGRVKKQRSTAHVIKPGKQISGDVAKTVQFPNCNKTHKSISNSANKHKQASNTAHDRFTLPDSSQNKQSRQNRKQKQVLSLPRKAVNTKKISVSNQSPVASHSHDIPLSDSEDPWKISAPSTKGGISKQKAAKAAQASISKKQPRLDSTVIGRPHQQQQPPRLKRQLVDQLSQVDERVKVARKTSKAESQTVLLWCENEQSRPATDIMALDVVFQAAMDLEEELRDSIEGVTMERLVKKVFSGVKKHMKLEISQDLEMKTLERDVQKRKQACKRLAADLSETQAEAVRLEGEVLAMEKGQDGRLIRISQWMKDYSQLSRHACVQDTEDSNL